jgi:hypothetical protein
MNDWIEQFLADDSCVLRMKTRLHYAGVPEVEARRIRDAVIRERIRRTHTMHSVTGEIVAGVQ